MGVRDRTEAALARIAAAPEAAIFTRVYAQRARAEADAADARRRDGVTLGALDGVLVSIKDLFDVAGETTLAGSRLLADHPPAGADAPVVARLRRAGAVILGKTSMSEFAFSGLGLNPHTGTPGNAHDPARIPGGSSAGAGVAVALGLCDIAIGTDTGGSVRIPAAFNGIVGLKPTARRVPTAGAFPLSYTLDSIGPLAATVQACADADAVMSGGETGPMVPAALAGLRIGVPRGRLFADTEPAVAQAFEATLGRLSTAGARITDLDIEDILEAMRLTLAAAPIAAAEAAAIHADWLESRADAFDPRVLQRIRGGAGVAAPAYVRTLRRRAELVAMAAARLDACDVLALPTVPMLAPLLAPLEDDDAAFARTNLLALRNPTVGNFLDLCGLSLPMRTDGLPAWLMLMAPALQVARMLAIGRAVETL
jgi:aspartyl-tRNA(Asn)/glutamyl-tRNA(Gln) amidotransferase subunit A